MRLLSFFSLSSLPVLAYSDRSLIDNNDLSNEPSMSRSTTPDLDWGFQLEFAYHFSTGNDLLADDANKLYGKDLDEELQRLHCQLQQQLMNLQGEQLMDIYKEVMELNENKIQEEGYSCASTTLKK